MKEKILIAGGTGLVGQRLIRLLDQNKYEISIITRSKARKEGAINYLNWEQLAAKEKQAFSHVINLTGAGIADKRWSPARKKTLRDSRVKTTEQLVDFIKNIETKNYIGASAIGYYGDRGHELLDESSTAQEGSFMSEICVDWEKSHDTAKSYVANHFILRIGIVISSLDGALPKIKASVPFGIAPYLGDGSQYYSWIHIDDLCQIIIHMLEQPISSGVYNAVSPNPVSNKEFMYKLKKAMNKMAFVLPTPAFLIKTAFGEMSDTVLGSTKVSAQKLVKAGFQFKFAELGHAIKDVLSNKI